MTAARIMQKQNVTAPRDVAEAAMNQQFYEPVKDA